MLSVVFFAVFFLSKPDEGMGDFEEKLRDSFDELGVAYDNPIIHKCVEICKKYNVSDAEDFVDTWMAYSVSHLHGENPTLVNLTKFEREEYVKKSKECCKQPESAGKSALIIYGGSNIREKDEAARLLMAYNETTPKTKNKCGRDAVAVPCGSGIKRKYNYDTSPQATFSPASYSPTITTPSAKYITRTNAGDVVFRYNDDETERDWKCADNYVAAIELNSNLSFPVSFYMHNCLTDFLDYWDGHIEKIGKLLRSKHGLEDEMPMNHKGVMPFVLVGRIASDGEGRLTSKTALLEGMSDNASGLAVELDLSVLKKYSIFPGQVVAVEGYNLTKERLVVKELYSDVDVDYFKAYEVPRGPLNVIIASGPYTPTDSMTYEPLLDLVKEVARQEPHVLILTGPFIEANHPVLEENMLAETTEEFLEKVIEQIMKPLERKRTQVIIVNSYKDFTSPMVYPTPEIRLATRNLYPKLHLLPDPSLFAVEDVVFGVTSADVLLHLSKEEIGCFQEGGRLPRLAGHILQQRCFYPLAPPKEVPVDPLLMEHAKLEVAPHLLILPSDLRYFIKKVDKCVVVNPERLAKGLIGGTYARMIITSEQVIGNIVKI